MFKSRVPVALLAIVLMLQAGATVSRAQQPDPAPAGAQSPPAQTGQPAQPPQTPAPNAPAAQSPTFRGGINFVRVDAIVTDKKGQPITDLKQSDFEVLEDDKPQSIQQFRLVTVDGNRTAGDPPPRQIRNRDDEELEAARDDVRVFVLFLDDYHVRRANSISIREPLTRFIKNQLGPNDMVAVMYPLTPVQDVSFTRHFDSVLTAIDHFEGRKYDYTPRNQFEANYARYPAQAVEDIRNQVVMGALEGLAVRLGSLREGRKTVVYVGEGLTVMLPPQMQKPDATGPDIPQDPALLGAIENSGAQQTQEWFASSDLNNRMREVYTACNRNNTSLYTLDPRRLAVAEYDIDDGGINGTPGFASDRRALQMTQDLLRSMAEETDGRAIVNRNQVDAALAQAVRDSSHYYLIGYTSSEAPSDGKFHEIKVRVKRPGATVRARKGYWAATVEDLTKAAHPAPEVKKPIQQALASIAPIVNAAHYVQTWIGTARGSAGKTRVTLVWEPVPPMPGAAASARREQAGSIALLAADEKGDLVFRGRSPDAALASAASASTAGGGAGTAGRVPAPAATTPQKIVFDAPPGKLELKLTVEGAGGHGTLDNDERTIDVPDLTAPQAALSTPRVFRTRTARELNDIAADPNALPTAAREFSRTERLLIRFDVYGPGTEQPVPTAALLNRSGDKMADLPVTPAKAGGTHQINLGLNTLPAGEYLVQITAKGQGGEAQELVPFRIGT
jgi:VWFA-related protein